MLKGRPTASDFTVRARVSVQGRKCHVAKRDVTAVGPHNAARLVELTIAAEEAIKPRPKKTLVEAQSVTDGKTEWLVMGKCFVCGRIMLDVDHAIFIRGKRKCESC